MAYDQMPITWRCLAARAWRSLRTGAASAAPPSAPSLSQEEETRAWIAENGFQAVFNPFRPGYPEGFDRTRRYQFMRVDWDEPSVFALEDLHPLANLAGLYYR